MSRQQNIEATEALELRLNHNPDHAINTEIIERLEPLYPSSRPSRRQAERARWTNGWRSRWRGRFTLVGEFATEFREKTAIDFRERTKLDLCAD